jgi:uncharacterized membrane protein YvbJ
VFCGNCGKKLDENLLSEENITNKSKKASKKQITNKKKYLIAVMVVIVMSIISINYGKLKNYFNVNKSNVRSAVSMEKDGTTNLVEEDKVTTNADIVDNGNALTYTNKEYGFTMNVPYSWKDKFVVSESNLTKEAEKTINFDLILNGKNYGNIFSVLILKPQYNKTYVDNSFWEYITSNNNHVIAYSEPSEPSQEILNNPEVLGIMQNMLNNDLPKIIKTMKFKGN